MAYSVQNRKMDFITKILKQDVYMPSSGLYKSLAESLGKLSLSDLESLALFLDCKKYRARVDGNDPVTNP